MGHERGRGKASKNTGLTVCAAAARIEFDQYKREPTTRRPREKSSTRAKARPDRNQVLRTIHNDLYIDIILRLHKTTTTVPPIKFRPS